MDEPEVTQPWRPVPFPGKGIGLQATQDITSSSLLLSYRPVLLVHAGLNEDRVRRECLLRISIDQLSARTQSRFRNLSNQYHDTANLDQDILKSNAFEATLGPDSLAIHFAVIPEAARINHDCSPNAEYVFGPTKLTLHVYASREIATGEEITISYTDPFTHHATRQGHLSSFGFTCTCRRCSNAETSDQALDEILGIHTIFAHWKTSAAKAAASPEKALELIRLYEHEGLDVFMHIAHAYVALAYSAVGNEDECCSCNHALVY